MDSTNSEKCTEPLEREKESQNKKLEAEIRNLKRRLEKCIEPTEFWKLYSTVEIDDSSRRLLKFTHQYIDNDTSELILNQMRDHAAKSKRVKLVYEKLDELDENKKNKCRFSILTNKPE